MILGVHHVALATFDIERLAQFYCDAFGFEVIKVGGWERDSVRHELVTGLKASAAKTWMIQNSNFFIELFEYSEPTGVSSGERRLCDPGYTHICFSVLDIDQEYKRLIECGMTFHGPPPGERSDAVRAIYGRDPDGNVIELLEHQPGSIHPYHPRHLGLGPV